MEFKSMDGEEMPEIQGTTTGLRGWAGEITPTIKKEEGKKVQDGDLSNVINPFVAFDFECLMYVPEAQFGKVSLMEKFPISYVNQKSKSYYKRIPGAMERMSDLMRTSFNLMVVYVGPKHLWEHHKELAEPFPFTAFCAISTPGEFVESITNDSRVQVYYTLSEIRRQNAGPKGILFMDWSNLGKEPR